MSQTKAFVKPSAKMGRVVWWNGELVPSESANIHVTAHSLHYGMAAFEGIRAYELQDKRVAIFRGPEHMKRFLASCHTGLLRQPYSLDQLVEACKITVRESGLGACYLRPLAFLDAGPLGVAFDPKSHPVTVCVMSLAWGKYLGDDAFSKGARMKISSFTRHHPNISMTKAKFTGNYVNSTLAKLEARMMGFDEAILLDPEGYLAEGSGENLFILKDRKIFTPAVSSVLAGITRDSILSILYDMKVSVVERRITRDELYNADEAFLCGTAAEITPIAEVDMRAIGSGKPGEFTKEVSQRFFEIVTGKNPEYQSWLTPV